MGTSTSWNFDMEDVGKFKITTVKSIKTRDVHLCRRILTSVLRGVTEAVDKNDEDKNRPGF